MEIATTEGATTTPQAPLDTGTDFCRRAFFEDPDGSAQAIHVRYGPGSPAS